MRPSGGAERDLRAGRPAERSRLDGQHGAARQRVRRIGAHPPTDQRRVGVRVADPTGVGDHDEVHARGAAHGLGAALDGAGAVLARDGLRDLRDRRDRAGRDERALLVLAVHATADVVQREREPDEQRPGQDEQLEDQDLTREATRGAAHDRDHATAGAQNALKRRLTRTAPSTSASLPAGHPSLLRSRPRINRRELVWGTARGRRGLMTCHTIRRAAVVSAAAVSAIALGACGSTAGGDLGGRRVPERADLDHGAGRSRRRLGRDRARVPAGDPRRRSERPGRRGLQRAGSRRHARALAAREQERGRPDTS